jgi:hypothetical protein
MTGQANLVGGAADGAADQVSTGAAAARFMVGAARVLQFAAAPAFAVMALLAAMAGDGAWDILCGATQDASPLTGMAAMYGLMSAVHAAPWLRLMGVRLKRA